MTTDKYKVNKRQRYKCYILYTVHFSSLEKPVGTECTFTASWQCSLFSFRMNIDQSWSRIVKSGSFAFSRFVRFVLKTNLSSFLGCSGNINTGIVVSYLQEINQIKPWVCTEFNTGTSKAFYKCLLTQQFLFLRPYVNIPLAEYYIVTWTLCLQSEVLCR